MKLKTFATAFGFCLLACASVSFAQTGGIGGSTTGSTARPNGSLWNNTAHPLLTDYKAQKVGDTITVLVQESASASSSASTKGSQKNSVNFNGLNSPFTSLNKLLGAFGTGMDNSSDGSGQTNRAGTLITRMTAVIKQILPNGNMVIEGNRLIGVNSEKQKIVISGVIRPEDVRPDNTVSSINIANANIQFDGKGPVGDRQKRGLLTRLFGWLF